MAAMQSFINALEICAKTKLRSVTVKHYLIIGE